MYFVPTSAIPTLLFCVRDECMYSVPKPALQIFSKRCYLVALAAALYDTLPASQCWGSGKVVFTNKWQQVSTKLLRHPITKCPLIRSILMPSILWTFRFHGSSTDPQPQERQIGMRCFASSPSVLRLLYLCFGNHIRPQHGIHLCGIIFFLFRVFLVCIFWGEFFVWGMSGALVRQTFHI